MSVTCEANIQLQSEEFVSPILLKMPVFQPCTFHIISLIFYFLLTIDNLPRESTWLRFIYGLYPIIHVCLSIPALLSHKVKILSFWVHLNIIPTWVNIMNLYWPPIFQDIIINHASGWIAVFSNFLKSDFIGPIKESWRYMILSLLPSEWMWHCVYLIWPCFFLNDFQDKIFYKYPMIFSV